MPNIRRRLEALEKSLPPEDDTSTDEFIFKHALHRLSTENLRLLRSMAGEYQLGHLNRDLTPGESAAINAYTAALEQEIQLGGSR